MSWNHLREAKPVARKRHRCCLCGLEIPPGMKYALRVGADGGEIHQMHMHIQCEMATQSWSCEEWEECTDEWTFRHEVLDPAVHSELVNELDLWKGQST